MPSAECQCLVKWEVSSGRPIGRLAASSLAFIHTLRKFREEWPRCLEAENSKPSVTYSYRKFSIIHRSPRMLTVVV